MSFPSVRLSDINRSTPSPSLLSNSSLPPCSSSQGEFPAHQSDSIETDNSSSFTLSSVLETFLSIKDWFVRHLETLFSCFCNTSIDPIDPLLQDRMSSLLPGFEQSPINLQNPTRLVFRDQNDQVIEIHVKELRPTNDGYQKIHQILVQCQQLTYFKTTGPKAYVIVLPIETYNDSNLNWEPSYFLFFHSLINKDKTWDIYDSKGNALAFINRENGFSFCKDWMLAVFRGEEASNKGIQYRLRQNP